MSLIISPDAGVLATGVFLLTKLSPAVLLRLPILGKQRTTLGTPQNAPSLNDICQLPIGLLNQRAEGGPIVLTVTLQPTAAGCPLRDVVHILTGLTFPSSSLPIASGSSPGAHACRPTASHKKRSKPFIVGV